MSMVKPSLLYLRKTDEPEPRLAVWPELGEYDVRDSHEEYLQNFCMGDAVDTGPRVVCVAHGDEDALKYIDQCIRNVQVIAIRGKLDHLSPWAGLLYEVCGRHEIIFCAWDRHEIAASLGRKAYWDAIELLQDAVEYLRSPAVQASPEAMRTETNITRAIEALSMSGFKTPKR